MLLLEDIDGVGCCDYANVNHTFIHINSFTLWFSMAVAGGMHRPILSRCRCRHDTHGGCAAREEKRVKIVRIGENDNGHRAIGDSLV